MFLHSNVTLRQSVLHPLPINWRLLASFLPSSFHGTRPSPSCLSQAPQAETLAQSSTVVALVQLVQMGCGNRAHPRSLSTRPDEHSNISHLVSLDLFEHWTDLDSYSHGLFPAK